MRENNHIAEAGPGSLREALRKGDSTLLIN
jgi:hypothetical protein